MGRNAPMIGGIVLALICGGVLTAYFLRPPIETNHPTPVAPSLFGSQGTTVSSEERFAQEPISTATNLPEGYKRYTNNTLRISFAYESDASLKVFDEGNSAVTITVENEPQGHALQIYAIPYNKKQIEEDRFLLDLPSGVRKNEEAIMLDGVPAVAFMSEVALLGPTREVWLLHGGRLYEISVPLAMEEWLLKILPTFKFL